MLRNKDEKKTTLIKVGYKQSDEFTCGPAALLTAMRSLTPNIILSQEEEFLIWHEANSIFMGTGHPGCSAYGLALSAIKRGFKSIVSLELNGDNFLFSDAVQDGLQNKIHRWNEARFRQLFFETGGHEKLFSIECEDIRKKLADGFACVALTADLNSRNDGHWVVVDTIDDEQVKYFDPYIEKALHQSPTISSDLHRLSKNQFLEMMCYGIRRKKACIYLTTSQHSL